MVKSEKVSDRSVNVWCPGGALKGKLLVTIGDEFSSKARGDGVTPRAYVKHFGWDVGGQTINSVTMVSVEDRNERLSKLESFWQNFGRARLAEQLSASSPQQPLFQPDELDQRFDLVHAALEEIKGRLNKGGVGGLHQHLDRRLDKLEELVKAESKPIGALVKALKQKPIRKMRDLLEFFLDAGVDGDDMREFMMVLHAFFSSIPSADFEERVVRAFEVIDMGEAEKHHVNGNGAARSS